MKRWIALACCLASACGCSQSTQPTAQTSQAEQAPAAQSPATPSTANQSGSEQTPSAQPTANQRLVTDLQTLIVQSQQLEQKEDYAGAIATWDQVIERLAEEHGHESWQVVNARLAQGLVSQRSKFDLQQRLKALEIAQQETDAALAFNQGNFARALALVDQALEASVTLWGIESHLTYNIAFQRAKTLVAMQRWHDAELVLQGVCEYRLSQLGADHPETYAVYRERMLALQAMGDYPAALEIANRTQEMGDAIYKPESPELAQLANNIGVLCYDAGRYDEAKGHLQKALQIRETVFGQTSVEVGHVLTNLAQVELALNEPELASQTAQTAIEVFDQFGGLPAPKAKMQILQGTAAMISQAYDQAETHFRNARETLEPSQNNWPILFAEACFKLGVALGHQGKYPQAEIQLKLALQLQQALLPADDPALLQTDSVYQIVLQKLSSTRVGNLPTDSLQR